MAQLTLSRALAPSPGAAARLGPAPSAARRGAETRGGAETQGGCREAAHFAPFAAAVAGSRRRGGRGRVARGRAVALVPRAAARQGEERVRLTGNTLAASLKMQCELAGADYAIFWTNVNGELVVSSDYETPERQKAMAAKGQSPSWGELSQDFRYPVEGGNGPISVVYRSDEPLFVEDASLCETMRRKPFAQDYEVKSICFVPCEDGVLEFGSAASWAGIPPCLALPKREIRKAFEEHGAKYVMLWGREGGDFAVLADYKVPERLEALRNRRKDDESFVSMSRRMRLAADGDGPVANAAKLGMELFFQCEEAPTLERADLAKEFGVKAMHMMPVEGGVLECGIPADAQLTGNTLAAAMKMNCDTTGAAYAIYWTELDGQLVVSSDYITPLCQLGIEASGTPGSFPAASRQLMLDAAGNGPVAQVARFGQPIFIPNPATDASLTRTSLAAQYGVDAIHLKAVPGGVLELGAIGQYGSNVWRDMPECPDLPKAEMKDAFEHKDAVYVMFWQLKGSEYMITADFTTPEYERALRSRRSDSETFVVQCRPLREPVDGEGYVATAGQSGKQLHVQDAKSDSKLGRGALAEEFGISEVHFVPCKMGILEYGTASI